MSSRCYEDYCPVDQADIDASASKIGALFLIVAIAAAVLAVVYGSADVGNLIVSDPSNFIF